MVRVGVVLESLDGWAQVAASVTSACGQCCEQGACGLVLIPPKDDQQDVIRAENPVQARPGDLVEIDLHGSKELKLSALVWGLPLSGLVGGAIGGAAIHRLIGMTEDTGVLIGCGLGLVAAWLLLRLIDRRAAADTSLAPRILRVIKTQVCQQHTTES